MVEIRFGTEKDIIEILNIQAYWLSQNHENTHGFLFGEPYKFDDIEILINANQVAVAYKDDKVCGYFLFDNYSKNTTTNKYRKYINELIILKELNTLKDSICPRAQIAIDKSFLGLNISKYLTKYLQENSPKKFSFIFSTISKKNSKIKKHLDNGWKIIGENNELLFVLLKVKTKHNNVYN